MFSLRKNSTSSHSPLWNSNSTHSHSNSSSNTNNSSAPRFSRLLSSTSLEPAIDGPPSSENIRAYTEQMKRSSFFTSNSANSRSTVSSSASSFQSGSMSSGTTSRDVSLSRTSSNASSMNPTARDRPESIQIFGKAIFSRRSSRKTSKRDRESTIDSTAKNAYYGGRSTTLTDSLSSLSERDEVRTRISRPFNFQHITHTGREYLEQSDAELASSMSLSSSAHSLRPATSHGQLKGIRASDLHFENFSSERLPLTPETQSEDIFQNRDRPRTSPGKRNTLRKSTMPAAPQPRQRLQHARSYDTLQLAPPRPPRSPLHPPLFTPYGLNMTSPLPPPRTSSRTPSMMISHPDPLSTTTLSRPESATGFRRPKAFHLPISPPRPMTRDFENEGVDLVVQRSLTPRVSAEASWPLSAVETGTFEGKISGKGFGAYERNSNGSGGGGAILADVPEEDETIAARKRMSVVSNTVRTSLRHSQSVPALSTSNFPDDDGLTHSRPMTPDRSSIGDIGVALSPTRDSIGKVVVERESWEDDIDYCYEHAVEADFEYDWDRCSIDGKRSSQLDGGNTDTSKRASIHSPSQRQGQIPHRPVPLARQSQTLPPLTPLDLPALTPHSAALSSPYMPSPYTPGPPPSSQPPPPHRASNYPQQHTRHNRPSSHASSFKESHGFHLSPSLLVPSDWTDASSADLNAAEDNLYDELFGTPAHHQVGAHALHPHNKRISIESLHLNRPYHPRTPGTVKVRNSNDSTASGPTGPSSSLSKSASLESVVLLSRAANVALQHRSIVSVGSSSSSLPELVHSLHSSREIEMGGSQRSVSMASSSFSGVGGGSESEGATMTAMPSLSPLHTAPVNQGTQLLRVSEESRAPDNAMFEDELAEAGPEKRHVIVPRSESRMVDEEAEEGEDPLTKAKYGKVLAEIAKSGEAKDKERAKQHVLLKRKNRSNSTSTVPQGRKSSASSRSAAAGIAGGRTRSGSMNTNYMLFPSVLGASAAGC